MARACTLIALIVLIVGCGTEKQYPTANVYCIDATGSGITEIDGELNLFCWWDCAHPPEVIEQSRYGTDIPPGRLSEIRLWIQWSNGAAVWQASQCRGC